jgi:hypothetical protein
MLVDMFLVFHVLVRDMLPVVLVLVLLEGLIRRTREGGSEWEPIKILLEGD